MCHFVNPHIAMPAPVIAKVEYLHVFELAYRFTPFVKDNRAVKGRELDIRGKCPLELAGYDISNMPLARILRGQLLGWPAAALSELVPNV